MSTLREISSQLGHLVAEALPRVAAVHSGHCASAAALLWSGDRLVTAASALGREERLEVSVAGERRPAELLGADAASDVAVLRLNDGVGVPAWPHAGALRVGELVVALGRSSSPFARLGIVSRVGGDWRLGAARFERYVESDIAPSAGLAGGALLDAAGALVGINSVAIARGRLVTVPVESVARLVESITAHGKVRRARLGVSVQRVELPAGLAQELGQRFGLIVLAVQPNSAAESAGVGLGDVLTQLGPAKLQSVDELQGALEADAIDAETALVLVRAGQVVRLSAVPRASA